MVSLRTERVLSVHHWNERLFSFRTTRDPSFRFENGHFVMVGLEITGKPLMRAYSIASPNYHDELEFFSIKVEDGPLTSHLQTIEPGQDIFVSAKSVGTLAVRDLRPGRNLYLFATGTGLAPFLSIIQDPETYEKFDHVVLAHGVRHVSDLAYAEFLTTELRDHPYLGEEISAKLLYYPTVTREAFRHRGRLSDKIATDDLTDNLSLPALDPELDRAMICGSPAMLKDISDILDARGFEISEGSGELGAYVVERAFAEK